MEVNHSDAKSFRSMWSAFTWENKISVHTNLNSLAGLIQRIAEVTHMKIVSDFNADADSDFMAANLYVRKFSEVNGRHDRCSGRTFC